MASICRVKAQSDMTVLGLPQGDVHNLCLILVSILRTIVNSYILIEQR